MVRRINFYGGPGSAKSTTAARIFSELKILNVPVELVTEYIKKWAWLKIIPNSFDQFYVFAKQLREEDVILRHQHTHVVTDSPIIMQLAYMKRGKALFYDDCVKTAKLFENINPGLHIFLKRTVPYIQEGRYENYNQALEMDNMIVDVLNNLSVPFITFDPIDEFNQIKSYIINWLEEL